MGCCTFLALIIALISALLGLGYHQATQNTPNASYHDIKADGGQYVVIGNRIVEYFQYGNVGDEDAKIVVFIHGVLMTGRFCKLFEDYGKKHNIWFICPSLPGWGASTPLLGREFDSTGVELIEILKNISIENKKVALVGFSLGSPNAVAAAHLLGSRVHVLTLLASVWPSVEGHDPYADDPANKLISVIVMPIFRDFFGYFLLGPILEEISVRFPYFKSNFPEMFRFFVQEDAPRAVRWHHAGYAEYLWSITNSGSDITWQLRNLDSSTKIQIWHYSGDEQVDVTNSEFILSKLSENSVKVFFKRGGDHLTVLGEMEKVLQQILEGEENKLEEQEQQNLNGLLKPDLQNNEIIQEHEDL